MTLPAPFEFDFNFQDNHYTAECRVFPIDGSTEVQVTPLNSELFEIFGVRILMLTSDGSVSANVPALPDERDYILALADGLSSYLNNESYNAN